jgi:hypothetical protein
MSWSLGRWSASVCRMRVLLSCNTKKIFFYTKLKRDYETVFSMLVCPWHEVRHLGPIKHFRHVSPRLVISLSNVSSQKKHNIHFKPAELTCDTDMSLPDIVFFSPPSPTSPLSPSPSSYNFPLHQYISVSLRITTNQSHPPPSTVPPEYIYITRPPIPQPRPPPTHYSHTNSPNRSL